MVIINIKSFDFSFYSLQTYYFLRLIFIALLKKVDKLLQKKKIDIPTEFRDGNTSSLAETEDETEIYNLETEYDDVCGDGF